jgi:hypothetical protein
MKDLLNTNNEEKSMGKEDNKSKKWLILGSIVFIIALLIAVGPLLVTKYMRTKWQTGPRYRTSALLMSVQGTLLLSEDKTPYILGNNELYYLLKNLKEEDLNNYLNKTCFVLGKMSSPKDKKIDGHDVRMVISVDKISETDFSGDKKEVSGEDKDDNVSEKIKEKTSKKIMLRLETNRVLNKPILFDVVKGKLSLQTRKKKDGTEVSALVLTDEFGDNYLLVSNGKLIDKLISDKDVICLGREIMPLNDMYLVIDEMNFEIYEVYDLDYNKIK